MSAAIRLEKLSEENLPAAHALFVETFGPRISLEDFRKKYDTSYCGVRHICYLAYDRQQPVAFYGALPGRFEYKGERFLAVQACDSITREAYRGKGIHHQLANATYEEMAKHGLSFVFALHSAATYGATKNLGWELGAQMLRFHLPVRSLPLARIARKLKWNVIAKRAERFFAPHTVKKSELKNPLCAEGAIAYRYDEAFFGYKSYTPNRVLRFGDALFWIKLRSVLEIGAAGECGDKALAEGLQELKKLCAKIGVNEIQLHATPGSRLAEQLKKNYPALPSWPIGFRNFSCRFPMEQLKFNPGDLDTF